MNDVLDTHREARLYAHIGYTRSVACLSVAPLFLAPCMSLSPIPWCVSVQALAQSDAAWKTESLGLDRGKAAARRELDKVLTYNQVRHHRTIRQSR